VVEFRDKSETAFTVKRRLPFEEEGRSRIGARLFPPGYGKSLIRGFPPF
jgi:hypothetical protein